MSVVIMKRPHLIVWIKVPQFSTPGPVTFATTNGTTHVFHVHKGKHDIYEEKGHMNCDNDMNVDPRTSLIL